MERKIVYFEKVGEENTEATLRIAKERAEELGIKTIVVASTRGITAARAVEVFDGMRVVAVGRMIGRRGPNIQDFTEANRRIVESKGGVVLNTKHGFGGFTRPYHGPVSEAVPQPPASNETSDIIVRTLRIFSTGMKAACEITIMAADSGLVRTDEDVIAIAGTTGGADTAVVLRPVNSMDFFDLRIKEILCKPYLAVTPPRQGVAAAERHH